MRRIIVYDRVSADGYFADAERKLDWAVPEEALDREAAGSIGAHAGPGTMLFGRRTYEAFESFWPHVAADPAPDAPDPHAEARRSPAMRAMATWIDEATKVVCSRTRDAVPWRNSRLLREIEPAAIEALKEEPGADIMVFGSGEVVSRLTALGLVDEYQLIVNPVLLGGGRNLIDRVGARTPLALLEAKAYPEGNVKLRYAPAGRA